MEEVDSISVAVSNIDINKVEPLENRRVVAFLNHFLCTTVTFLNQFAVKCEYKIDQIQQKLFKIESALRILESKLESLPELSNATPSSTNEQSTLQSHQKDPNLVKTENATTTPDNPISNPTNSRSTDDLGSMTSSASAKKLPNNAEDRTETEQMISAEDGGENRKTSNRQDPRYEKYFKMMYVGVPVPAIKQKMMSEGVDPAILDS